MRRHQAFALTPVLTALDFSYNMMERFQTLRSISTCAATPRPTPTPSPSPSTQLELLLEAFGGVEAATAAASQPAQTEEAMAAAAKAWEAYVPFSAGSPGQGLPLLHCQLTLRRFY
jgi:hypothetical protein